MTNETQTQISVEYHTFYETLGFGRVRIAIGNKCYSVNLNKDGKPTRGGSVSWLEADGYDKHNCRNWVVRRRHLSQRQRAEAAKILTLFNEW